MVAKIQLFLVAALAPFTSALIGKQQHSYGQAIEGDAITVGIPRPTPAPSNAELRRALDARQGSVATCGYVSGRQNDPFTCNPGSQCVFNPIYSNFGCCSGDISACAFQTSCFASSWSSLYTADGYNLGCTDSVNNHCQTYRIAIAGGLGGYTSLGCGPSSLSVDLRQTWISGQVTATGLTTSVFPAAKATAATTANSGSGSSSGSNGNTNSGTSASAATLISSSARTTSTASLTPDTGSSGSPSGTSTGGSVLSTNAIIGIAVGGGVVVILALTLLFRCILANRRRQRQFDQPQNGPGLAGHGLIYPQTPQNPQNWHAAPTQVGAETVVGSSVAPSKMTQANMNAHLGSNEWNFAQGHVPQRQAAAVPTDGINVTEIYPDEAIDERLGRQPAGSAVGSQAPLTAVAPTFLSHHVQGV